MIGARCFELKLDDFLDTPELMLNIAIPCSLQDVPGFLFAANLHEPTWGLWEEVDADSNDEDENNLKSEGGSPCHGHVWI